MGESVPYFHDSNQPRLNVERLIDFRTLQERNAKIRQTTERRKSRHRLSVSRRGQSTRNKVFKKNFKNFSKKKNLKNG